jgi:hypothetical protein
MSKTSITKKQKSSCHRYGGNCFLASRPASFTDQPDRDTSWSALGTDSTYEFNNSQFLPHFTMHLRILGTACFFKDIISITF